MNGTYFRQRDTLHHDRPTFRTLEPVGQGHGLASGNHLFLYYHGKNKAWVIGLKVSDGAGAAAFCMGSESSPEVRRGFHRVVAGLCTL